MESTPGGSARVSAGILMCGRISEFTSSCEASIFRAQAFGDERFGASIEVELYLFADLAVEFRATEDGSEPVSDAMQHCRPGREEKSQSR
jgi:hypothetical protein